MQKVHTLISNELIWQAVAPAQVTSKQIWKEWPTQNNMIQTDCEKVCYLKNLSMAWQIVSVDKNSETVQLLTQKIVWQHIINTTDKHTVWKPADIQ